MSLVSTVSAWTRIASMSSPNLQMFYYLAIDMLDASWLARSRLLCCLLAHSLPGRLAPFAARPGLSWPAHRSNAPSPPGRQVDRCRVGIPEAQERQRGRGGGQGPDPASSAPLLSWPPRASWGRQRAAAGLSQARHRACPRRGERARRRGGRSSAEK